MTWHLAPDFLSYEDAKNEFSWDTIPDDYNIAYDLLRKHDDLDATALEQYYLDGRHETYSFRDLDVRSNRLANGLSDLGVGRGDRVAVVVPQKPANPLTHLACWKLGAISLPLSILFGEDSLRYRLNDSGAKVVVVDSSVRATLDTVREDCPDLEHVIEVDRSDSVADGIAPEGGDENHSNDSNHNNDSNDSYDFDEFCTDRSESFGIAETTPDTPAIIIYTSGSTGPPKGVLHTHDLWLGHCPAFHMYFERTGKTVESGDSVESAESAELAESSGSPADSVYWTPADWAWIGALGDVLFPAWHYGETVVGCPMGGFDAETAYELLEQFSVTDTFLPPTAIRMMMGVENPTETYELSLRNICSGGEPLTPEIIDWAATELDGVSVNELYGQTEANLLVANCGDWFPVRAGSMGKPVPGHEIAIIDPISGEEKAIGDVGMIAVKREDDPIVFEEYWNQAEKTGAVTLDGWHLTGDLGSRDSDGYFWFKSRDDDVIITSGYRVGPGEVESAILEHPDVEQVGVVGVPDDTRGEIVAAFVQPASTRDGDDAFREEIRTLVRDKLAKYEYPRKIEFVAELPQTTTGKIQRRKLRESDE
ncbi:acetyl-CoA synthetase [Haladaptatus litoreus]|uniref:Acetyl-CoA synthetase n=1 Tax=Haladaptatus litoreus TaxID=553468 RepID=A0A1N7E2J8_9EURY|nr:AMP-binding protein [Haladaptatus litoreus]SIR82290.1 acetyl-CoA synthetase [Haladaptatus litoreus]